MLPGVQAVVISRPGGAEVLELREVADPTFGPDEVLVRVHASAMNRADLLQRRGLYPAPPGSPRDIPGLEFAGEVESCGARVEAVRPGDRVMGILGGGGHAEKIVLHERLCIPVPPGLSWEEAAAVPEAFLTSFDALFARARLAPGEALLVQAASSGVGTAAVQIARVAGARVIALSRTAEKRRRLAALHLDHVLDPALPDLADEIRSASGARGVDVVLQLVGATSFAIDMEVLADRGRIVVVGVMGGSTVTADLFALMRKRAMIMGTVLRARELEEKIALSQEFARLMLPLFEDGRLRPVVDRVLPLSEIATAHALLESNQCFGKIVLRIVP